MSSDPTPLEEIEIHLLLEGIYRYHGYDFRNYASSSIKRRITGFLTAENLSTVSALQNRVLHDRECFDRFVRSLTVNVTSMFRDPSFYLAFRNHVIPTLRTYPFIRIWHAGCSTGEEVYSMAILLQEEGLYDRCRLYGTDANEQVLQTAKQGIYPLRMMKAYTQLYLKSGGVRSFSEYYTAAYEEAILRASLKKNIVFAQHNLVTDGSFNEFNVICCRNVLIYFNQTLQTRVHNLFYDSLCPFGVLGLGQQESIKFTQHSARYQELSPLDKLYRKVDSVDR
ncbi:MAG: protein-glutamate O-methyltransferase CheR [Myxacorys chilensis ATA2-1-KO14]|jgi:chemotaxis protein methyltransferase CheR|nr:protein-glutamate O-methyltransferase CheR [Myxacorys chilensis ATA2-1-KO14]